MGRNVNVVGVGMVKFAKPGASEEYDVMAGKAIRTALEDAGVPWERVEQAYAGYVYGDSTAGQAVLIDSQGKPILHFVVEDGSRLRSELEQCMPLTQWWRDMPAARQGPSIR